MSFFDMLHSMGLFQGQQQPPQGGQAPAQPQQNPYGLDPATARMVGFQTLGNISQQLLALGQQMTPQQRASMIPQMDFTGGIQNNLYNAAQMKLAQRDMAMKDQQYQGQLAARQQIADKIKATPPGRMRDAAMFYLQAGDLQKAGELLFSQNRLFDATTGQYIYVDAMGNPVDSPAAGRGGYPVANSGVGAKPGKGGVAPLPVASGGGSVAPVSGATRPMPPATGADGGQVDQLTRTWRALTKDPTLTPQEAQMIAVEAGTKQDPAAGLALYRDMKQKQQQQDQQAKTLAQTNLDNTRSSAEQLTSQYATDTKSYDTVIQNGQLAVQVARNPNMSAADKLGTLYQFMRTLDPLGSVRDGDVAMAQSIQSALSNLEQKAKSAVSSDGTISNDVVLDMAKTMARLANDAAGRKEKARLLMVGKAKGRQIPVDMVSPDMSGGTQNVPLPIGYNPDGSGLVQPQKGGAPRGPDSDGPNINLPPADQSLFSKYFGG